MEQRTMPVHVRAWALLLVICCASAATIVLLGSRLTFFNDDWYFLLQRPGLDGEAVFAPHNGHLSALAVLIYKGLIGLFGLDSQLPFRVVLAVTVVALGIVMYALVSERAGPVLGLLAAAIVVFLGPAWEDLLWSFQIGLIGSLASGLAAILVLERNTGRRNALACVLLICSISLSDLGVPFVVAAAIAVCLRRRPRELWIPAVPALLFGIWWIAYGSDATSNLSLANVKGLPEYVLDSVANGLVSLAGLTEVVTGPWPQRFLVAVAAIAVAAWLIRGGRPSPWVLVFAGAALTFWGLAGAGYIPGREPFASRYQLVHVTFMILIAAELFRPVRPTPWQAAAAVGIALVVLGLNANALSKGFDFMRDHSTYAKVDLGALEIARGGVAPSFQLFENVAHDPYLTGVTAGRYFSETDAHGSPQVYSPEQIAHASPPLRHAADHVMAAGYGIRPEPTLRSTAGTCRSLPDRLGPRLRGLTIASGESLLTNLSERRLVVGVRRFAPSNRPTWVGFLKARETALIAIPRDRVRVPWRVTGRGASALRVCGARG